MNLLTAYQFHRARPMIRLGRGVVPLKATAALDAARADMLAYRNARAHLETVARIRDDAAPGPDKQEAESAYRAALQAVTKATRYAPGGPSRVYYQPENRPRTGERLAHVERPESMGLRYVGRTVPETGRDVWDSRGDCGWHTDPFGDVFKDGSGLCFGVVYQLPAKDGRARFIAGYEFGGVDGGPTLDLGHVYESESSRGLDCSYEGAQGHDDARDAARAADSMAQRAAEQEREYQTAWQLGRTYDDARQEASDARTAARELLAERRQAKGTGNAPAICRAIRDSIAGHLETIRAARATMAAALQGDGPGLCVYLGERERDAFCEAAGLDSFPS